MNVHTQMHNIVVYFRRGTSIAVRVLKCSIFHVPKVFAYYREMAQTQTTYVSQAKKSQ